ncbi:MAG: serine hydroxymethyltransferase [Candidatus Bipolaricaulaceae bacterium]
MDERLLWTMALAEMDAQLQKLINAEERRQRDKIILIPSESLTPVAVREALQSVFTSIYAEGYPREETLRLPESRLVDLPEQLAYFRRYADRRFYKGVEMADVLESLACRRAAECFANELVGPDEIFANVQPLSGAAANMAIYDALLSPGDTLMALDLTQGGHLSHGSPFHQSGRRFKVVPYSVDPRSERLDYNQILDLAKRHRPKMIVAGYTSYPWAPSWEAFREIADAAGALLLADIAHTAGMAAAGAYPNPVGHADVVMFTTHKTLAGPRGAVILTCDPDLAKAIELAVFPGAQGGPHVNKFAAMACAFQIARTESFRTCQHRIVDNARHLAHALQQQGLRLCYGGTDTHLLVIDLRKVRTPNGQPLMGEIAARLLDLVGLVANKNTIPGDTSAADARGIRYGTPWVTQRGMGKAEMEEIAEITARVLTEIRPFSYLGLTGPLSRGKVPVGLLSESRARVARLARRGADVDGQGTGQTRDRTAAPCRLTAAVGRGPSSPCGALLVQGGRAGHLLHEASSAHILSLTVGRARRAALFDADAQVVAEAIVGRLPDGPEGGERFAVLAPPGQVEPLRRWLAGLADGYVLFDHGDIYRKVQGPAVVSAMAAGDASTGELAFHLEGEGDLNVELDGDQTESRRQEALFAGVAGDAASVFRDHPHLFAPRKPYFVGGHAITLPEAKDARAPIAPSREGQTTPLTEIHRQLGAKLVQFAGYQMPAWYSSALAEHRAVRQRAGLFDLGHMGIFEVAGRYAESFLNLVTTNYAGWLHPGQSQYGFLLTPAGEVIDDLMVYRRARDRFLVVVNAANEARDWDWMCAVNSGQVLLDPERPWVEPDGEVTLANLKEPHAPDPRIDLALQGPASRAVLVRLVSPRDARRLRALRRTEFLELSVGGRDVLCARTGYTGEGLGYELYVHPQDAEEIWGRILEAGEPFQVAPCGLAARDSLRTEAGLPLFGHELAGRHHIAPHEAGFAPYVKLHKPFFVGREAYLRALEAWKREVVRFRIPAGSRPIRAEAGVVDRSGRMLGWVTSCTPLEDGQVGMALLERRGLAEGTPLGFLVDKDLPARLEVGARLPLTVWGELVTRFPVAAKLPQPGGE